MGRLLALVGAASLVGCGSASSAAKSTATARPTPVASASATPDPRDAGIIKAYLDATAAFVHAEKAMDPSDPELAATMTGEELSTVTKNLIINRAGGLIARGDVTSNHPHVVSDDGATAVVRDCVYSALLLYDAKTGGPAPGVANGPQDIAVSTTLVFVDGRWKVSLQDGKVGTCPLGY